MKLNYSNLVIDAKITKEKYCEASWQEVSFKDRPLNVAYLRVVTIDRDLRYYSKYYVLLNGKIEVVDGKAEFRYYEEKEKENEN